MGYEYHLDSALVKPTREMAQTSGFDPTLKVKTCYDCKMFDVANWVPCLSGKDGPGGSPSHGALSVSSRGALVISAVIGHTASLVRDHFSLLRVLAQPCKHNADCKLSPQRPQCTNLLPQTKVGRSLRASL